MKEIDDASKISKQITRQSTYSVSGSKNFRGRLAYRGRGTPKYTKKADPAGQEALEEPEENIKPKSRCDTLSIFIAGDKQTI